VTNAVWGCADRLRDAAEKIGDLYVNGGSRVRESVARMFGSHIEIESTPDDLMRGKGSPNEDGEFDEFEFDAARHPDIVGY
jgi:hypothetical protein